MKSKNNKFLNRILNFGMFITIIGLALTPFIVKAILENNERIKNGLLLNSELSGYIIITVYICSVPFLLGIYYLKRLILSELSDDYIGERKKSLKNIALCAFSELGLINISSLVFLFKFVYDKNIFFETVISIGVLSIIILFIGFLSIISYNRIKKEDRNSKLKYVSV